MRKLLLMSFVLTCLFSNCHSSKVDWKEKFAQAQEETKPQSDVGVIKINKDGTEEYMHVIR